MPVINICFLCAWTTCLRTWTLRMTVPKKKKKLPEKYIGVKKSTGVNRQQPVWMIASLEERQVHFSQVPFTAFHVTYCVYYYVYYIFLFIEASSPAPSASKLIYSSNANLRRPILHCFIRFSDFAIVNTQVSVCFISKWMYFAAVQFRCRLRICNSVLSERNLSVQWWKLVCTIAGRYFKTVELKFVFFVN